MKKITLSLALLLFAIISSGQLAIDSIEINTLKLKVYADGGLEQLQTFDDTTYKTLMYAQNLWLGGIDANSNLHMAAQTYRQSRVDFTPGPISNDPNVYSKYNKAYRINLQTITDFVNGKTTGVPPEIANWPAHGDPNMGEAYDLAPYVDVNQDNKYVPVDGDYPDIKGDEAIFVIFNDGNDTTSLSPLGVEIHAMIYGYQTGGVEDSILFINYKVFNRSSNTYTDTYLGSFSDFDNGNPRDDIIGTHVSANSIYAYNGDSDDEGPLGFGTYLASCGLRILQGPPADLGDGIDNDMDGCVDGIWVPGVGCQPENPGQGLREYYKMSGSMYFMNMNGPQGNPNFSADYYNLLQSLWNKGNDLIIENPSGILNAGNGDGYVASNTGVKTTFMFPGNTYDTTGAFKPDSPVNWFCSPMNLSDMRALANAGPFTLGAGESFEMSTALTWVRDSGFFGLPGIQKRLAGLDKNYNNQPTRYVGLNDYLPKADYDVFCSPDRSDWFIQNNDPEEMHFELYSLNGQKVAQLAVPAGEKLHVPIADLAAGVYLLHHPASGGSHKIVR